MTFDRHGRISSAFSQNDISNSIKRLSHNGEMKENDINNRVPKQSNREGHPYLDEEGNICQDKMEVMQHVEYDTQIHCEVFYISYLLKKLNRISLIYVSLQTKK